METSIQLYQHIRSFFKAASMGLCALALALFLFSCSGPATPATDTEATATETAEQAADAITFTQDDIDALKAKFVFDEATGYYYAKHWNRTWPKRKTLTADINQTGYFFLCSNYYDDKAIKHTKIKVTIGEEVFESDAVELDSQDHRTEKAGAKNFEVNYYTNYRDKGILKAIANSSSDAEIKVAFIGKTTRESILPKSDIQALKDCHNLSLVLRSTPQ